MERAAEKMDKGIRLGFFITLEGPEGGGKTSQAKELAERLRQKGLAVSVTREPGGTPISDKIRQLLIDPDNKDMLPLTELLLFEASRYQHVQQFILPKLRQGEIVICDRFYDSSLAYQGARNLPLRVVAKLNELVASECEPDITLLLDLDYETGRSRLVKRYSQNKENFDRIELEKKEFFERLRQNYLNMAKGRLGKLKFDVEDQRRWHVIDASQSFSEISAQIWQIVEPICLASVLSN